MVSTTTEQEKKSFLRRYFLENHFLFINLGIIIALALTGLLGPMIREITLDLGLPLDQQWKINMISSVFALTVAGFAFLWVVLESKYPRKLLLIVATSIWATAISITGFFFFFDIFSSYEQLFILMELAAIGFAGIIPLSYSLTMDYYAPHRRGKAFGFIDMSSSLGTGFAPLLAGFLVDFQWALPFIIVGCLGYAANILLIRIREPKRGCQEAQLADLIESGVEYRFGLSKKGVKEIFKKRANILIFSMLFFYVTAQAGLAFFFITMMKSDHGFNSTWATILFLIIFQVQIYAPVVWGLYADKLFAKRPDGKIISIIISLAIGIIPYMVGFSLQFQASNLPMIILFSILLMIGAFFVMGVSARAASVMGEINSPEVRATTFALNYLCDTGGTSFGYFLVGVLFLNLLGAGVNYSYGMVLVCLGYLMSMILALVVRKQIPKELENLKSVLEKRADEMSSCNE